MRMNQKNTWVPMIPVLLALLGASASTYADDTIPPASKAAVTVPSPDKGKEGPCRTDAEKFCPGLTRGKGLFKCMKEHKAELSPACTEKMAVRKEKRKEWRERKESQEKKEPAKS
jgi:hypothetical protein